MINDYIIFNLKKGPSLIITFTMLFFLFILNVMLPDELFRPNSVTVSAVI